MSAGPAVSVRRIGREDQPLAVVDGFAPDPDALRAAALAAAFGPALHQYPGLRAALPDDYWPGRRAMVAAVLDRVFGMRGPIGLVDASFSVVTAPPDALSVGQRLPHCDAFSADRFAFVHFLSPAGGDGTAFFRHRSTGFETVDEARRPIYLGQLEAELRHGGPPPAGYLSGDTPLFERTALAEARWNRALLYRSRQLHSGAIARPELLSADPAAGRLTVTGFLSVGSGEKDHG